MKTDEVKTYWKVSDRPFNDKMIEWYRRGVKARYAPAGRILWFAFSLIEIQLYPALQNL